MRHQREDVFEPPGRSTSGSPIVMLSTQSRRARVTVGSRIFDPESPRTEDLAIAEAKIVRTGGIVRCAPCAAKSPRHGGV